MRKTFSSVIMLLTVLTLLCSLAISSYAASSVTYNANADEFIFAPGSQYSPTDLFTEYKGLMPGDSVKQEITVRNDSSKEVKVNIYIRSLGAQNETDDFLSQLNLSVAKSENNEMAYMFNAAADQTDGMTDWVFLGTLYSGGEVNLVLNLDIPIELGDEYQDAIGYIDWEFKVEELPVDPDDPRPPHTGDFSNASWYVLLAVVCVIMIIVMMIKRKRVVQE